MRNPLIAAAWLGLCSLGAAAAADDGAPLITVSRYVLAGENPLSAADSEALLAPLAGPKAGIGDLEADARRVEEGLRQRGYAFQRVIVPPQKPVAGVVELKVLSFRLDQIRVSGNQYFSTENILASLPEIRPGKAPDPVQTARELALANANPVKKAQVLIKAKPGTDAIDADILVQDHPPLAGYAQLANNGSPRTGMDRISAGFRHANLFDRDHVLSFSYTTSWSHSDDVRQYGASYLIPFYGLGGSLAFYYINSNVSAGQVLGAFDVSGSGEFAGVSFNYTLPRFRSLAPTLSVSLEDRYFNSDINFYGNQLGNNVRSRPLSLRLQVRQDNPWGVLSAYAERAENLVSGSANGDAAYERERAGARSHWQAWRFGADLGARLGGDWRLLGRLRAQWADAPLIAGEQFGVGGAWSVRGFQERAIAGDSGWFVSVETLTPALFAGFRGAAFVDVGDVANHAANGDPTKISQTVASAGVGFRYQDVKGIEARADLAHVMRGVTDVQATGTWRGHVAIIYRF